MFKFNGKKWEDMDFREKLEAMDVIHKWLLPIRILVFPIALVVKLYKWTYEERA